jgi:hypothetical protein
MVPKAGLEILPYRIVYKVFFRIQLAFRAPNAAPFSIATRFNHIQTNL